MASLFVKLCALIFIADGVTAISSRAGLKAMGLSEAVPDNGPVVPPAPRLRSGSARSWCDMMEEEEGWFKCKDGKDPYCIAPVLVCDGDKYGPGCQDGSDEENCAETPPPQDSRPAADYCYECTDLQRKMLDKHNVLRRQENAANMNELNWSGDDERAAKAQADLCALPDWGESAHGNMEPDYGQNVARYHNPGQITDEQALDMIQWWHDEKQDYTYATDSCTDGKKCGHYTALASAYERNVGCSLKKCDRSKDGERKVFWNLVCNYSVWPNWKVWVTHPSQPFIQGKSCSQCQPGLECRNNLCA